MMDCVVDNRIYKDVKTYDKITKHEQEVDVHDHDQQDDLISEIPDEDSKLLVQFQGSDKSYKTKIVQSFSLTKVTN